MAAWGDPRKIDDVLHSLVPKLDGSAAAASLIKRVSWAGSGAVPAVAGGCTPSSPRCTTRGPGRRKQWTDTGMVHEVRGLKGRAKDDTRVVPCRPALTRVLREHVKAEGPKPGDLLFPG